MNPLVHAELSWLVAQPLRQRRDRIIVTCAGLVPDLDGLTLLAGTEAYGRYHHVLTHGLLAAAATAGACLVLSRQRAVATLLALGAFHLHLLCDLVGSGPGWPILYFEPFSNAEWFWSGQWNLASWQNAVVGLVATLASLSMALWRSRTPLELVSLRLDALVVRTLRARFLVEGEPPSRR